MRQAEPDDRNVADRPKGVQNRDDRRAVELDEWLGCTERTDRDLIPEGYRR